MSSSNGTQQPPKIKTSPSLSRPSPHHSSSPVEWNNDYSVGTSHALGRAEHSGIIGRGYRGKWRGRGRGRGGRNQHWSSSDWSAGRGRGGRGNHHHHRHHHNNNDNHGTADKGDYGEVQAPPPESSIVARSPQPFHVGGRGTGAVDGNSIQCLFGRGWGGGGGGGGDKRPAPPESAMSPEDRRPAVRQRGPPGDGGSNARATKREKRSKSRQVGEDGGSKSDSGSPREDEGALIGNSVLQRREVKLKVSMLRVVLCCVFRKGGVAVAGKPIDKICFEEAVALGVSLCASGRS